MFYNYNVMGVRVFIRAGGGGILSRMVRNLEKIIIYSGLY
jgi:hypothetical protein